MFVLLLPYPAAVVAKDLESNSKPDQEPEPALKKQKTASSTDGNSSSSKVIRQDLFSDDSRSSLRDSLQNAQPYTHVVIKELCDPAVLRAVRDEVIHNISATYKETDLFKVFQTGEASCGRVAEYVLVAAFVALACTCL